VCGVCSGTHTPTRRTYLVARRPRGTSEGQHVSRRQKAEASRVTTKRLVQPSSQNHTFSIKCASGRHKQAKSTTPPDEHAPTHEGAFHAPTSQHLIWRSSNSTKTNRKAITSACPIPASHLGPSCGATEAPSSSYLSHLASWYDGRWKQAAPATPRAKLGRLSKNNT
jgi:hypothetical protein